MPIGVRPTWLAMIFLLSSAALSVMSDEAAGQNEAAKATAATVPAVVGESAREARRMLAAAGLVARFQIGRAPMSPAEALRVYAADPKPGMKLKRGSDVHVTIYAALKPAAASEIKEGIAALSKPAKLPQNVTAEIVKLQARELELIQKPPRNLSPEQIDKELAELRWSAARQYGTHDIAGAISYARASLRLAPNYPERWEQLGDLCNLSGELSSAQDAAAAYEKALELEPPRHSARLKLAGAYLVMQRPERSIKHLELYLVAMGDEADPQAIGLYAIACAAAGETARGVAFCRANVEAGGSNRYRIAWAIMENALGNRDEAVKILGTVEESEAKSSPLAAYAAELRRTYLSETREPK